MSIQCDMLGSKHLLFVASILELLDESKTLLRSALCRFLFGSLDERMLC